MGERLDRVMGLAAALSAVCLLVSVCDPTPARADDCTRFVAVAAGGAVPCDGVLFPAGEAARFLLLEDERDRLKVDLAAERGQHEATRVELAGMLKIERDARHACERDKAPAPVARAWWDSPWLGAALGTVVGVAAGVAIGFATR
jgi:hypothetical protein